jgi:RND family efflux transporter MFP subunit
MTPTKCLRSVIFLLAAILFLPVPGLSQDKSEAPKRPPAPVVVVPVVEKQVSRQVTLVGSVDAVATSIVAAEVGGVVASFPGKEGRQVKKGDPLVRLKARELELERKGRVAERERIKANLENAAKELERVGRLRENKSLPQRTYDDALYAHRAMSQALLVAESQIDTLAYRIDRTTVTAPFDGFVVAEHTQVGQWIQSGGPVVTLVDISSVRVAVDVPERYAVQLLPESRVRVTIPSMAGEVRDGRIDVILPRGDSMTRTFPVRVLLDNSDFAIKAGMEAAATFDLSDRTTALMVPKDAVVTAGDRSLVYLVRDARAVAASVTVVGYHEGLAAVSGDLKAGDMAVIRGNERLMPGQDVAAKTED